ncbi:oxidoreductase, NAD-binding/iron-sulfur cluster-binding protein, partial [Nitratireductor pacificus pht-3B]
MLTCSPQFMNGVFDAGLAQGWPHDSMHREYFVLPETPDWVNH